jgi:hypothetical protein
MSADEENNGVARFDVNDHQVMIPNICSAELTPSAASLHIYTCYRER